MFKEIAFCGTVQLWGIAPREGLTPSDMVWRSSIHRLLDTKAHNKLVLVSAMPKLALLESYGYTIRGIKE
jgi:hypothetical protein